MVGAPFVEINTVLRLHTRKQRDGRYTRIFCLTIEVNHRYKF